MLKVMFFTVGQQPTQAELDAIADLNAKRYEVQVRNSALLGGKVESCDYIAGDLVPPGYEEVPAWGGSSPEPEPEPSTIQVSSADFQRGLAGGVAARDGKLYWEAQVTVWAGFITGTEAKLTFGSDYGDFDGVISVSVDDGAFSQSVARAGNVHTLFTGLPQAKRFVQLRIPPELGNAGFILSTGNLLEVTGAPPLVTPVQNWVKTDSPQYNGSTIAVDDFLPKHQHAQDIVIGSNIGSAVIRGRFNELYLALNGGRHIGVSKDGGLPAYYTWPDEDNLPVKVVRIPCDGSLATYNVWDNGNSRTGGGVYALAGDAAPVAVTARRLDQYGDSVTFGAGPGATPVHVENMPVAAFFGMIGSTNGISGETIEGGAAMIDAALAGKTVAATDVAILALGGNNASDGISEDEKTAYGVLIDKLLTAGYAKVLCRGIIPVQSADVTAANAALKSVVDAKANPAVVWVATAGWTTYETQDGVHPTAAGYAALREYAKVTYAPMVGS